jgi:hypothetical protein
MADWASYSLQDMLLFSGRVYFRQFELANESVWPSHLAFMAAGLFAGFAMWRGEVRQVRLAAALLAVCVVSSAWVYLHTYYSKINWAVAYMVPAFALQSAMMLAVAATDRVHFAAQSRLARQAASALLAFVAVIYPLWALAGGRTIASAEVLGIAADPTMLAVLAFASGQNSRWRWGLAAVPLVWCVLSGLTLYTLGSAQYLLVLAMALVGSGIMALPRSRPA